jgi:hypothetical protein
MKKTKAQSKTKLKRAFVFMKKNLRQVLPLLGILVRELWNYCRD